MAKNSVKKILNVVVDVVLVVFFLLCIFSLVLSITAKRSNDGSATFFGKEVRIVLTESMEKNKETDVSKYKIKDIKRHSLVFIERVPTDQKKAEAWYKSLKEGDVLTFRYGNVGEPITHRLVEKIDKDGGGYILVMQGDNASEGATAGKQRIDTTETDGFNYVIGKVTDTSYFLGLLVYAIKTPVGIVLIVIVPCLIIILLEVLRIISVLSEDKKQKQREESAAKEDEIERLKQRLQALESGDRSPPEERSGAEAETPASAEAESGGTGEAE